MKHRSSFPPEDERPCQTQRIKRRPFVRLFRWSLTLTNFVWSTTAPVGTHNHMINQQWPPTELILQRNLLQMVQGLHYSQTGKEGLALSDGSLVLAYSSISFHAADWTSHTKWPMTAKRSVSCMTVGWGACLLTYLTRDQGITCKMMECEHQYQLQWSKNADELSAWSCASITSIAFPAKTTLLQH